MAYSLNNRLQGTLFSDIKSPKKNDKEHCKVITTRSRIHIGESFEESMKNGVQVPKHGSSFEKRRLGEFETAALTEGCSVMATSQLPLKLKDPGSFTIPCNIGDTFSSKSLCDLGATINRMLLPIFSKFRSDEARPTTITLQLADRSTLHPSGIVKNMLVRVDNLIFPTNFIILDCEADKDVPIILGRPFLVIGQALLDVENGELTMCLNDEHITFNVLNDVSYVSGSVECFSLDVIDVFSQEHWEECYIIDSATSGSIEIEEFFEEVKDECCNNYI
ncbi:uncharacterized protein LOC120124749 [Hibiscus syriacus]|uniref:uncharacterized protein LOC120124749 n=1 Tax=Hibiscus syriacus TaxID=106335 RepID=UPI001922E18D|nr:uncharacterized protein LOC120124749 [Hibiscus syriacus]